MYINIYIYIYIYIYCVYIYIYILGPRARDPGLDRAGALDLGPGTRDPISHFEYKQDILINTYCIDFKQFIIIIHVFEYVEMLI